MFLPRVIPCLLIENGRLVKTVRFSNPNYVGDPINAIHIFNEMGVDELIVLDISATKKGRQPQFDLIETMASECFMPFAYGGGIQTLEQARRILKIGTEKIIINSQANKEKALVRSAAQEFGSQSVIIGIDAKRNFFGKYEVCTEGGRKNTHRNPTDYAKEMEGLGAGEVFLNSIDHDGTWRGYDEGLISKTAGSLKIPVIACGGAGKVDDFKSAIKAGASAVAAGSMFIYQKKGHGVLINYPAEEIKKVWASL